MTTKRTIGSTQRESIKKFLQEGYSLTPLEALSLFGAYRLAAHIEVLRKRGMHIHTQMCKDITGRSYARYSLPVAQPMVPLHFNNGQMVPMNKMAPKYWRTINA